LKVSIITPSYNQGEFLEHTIRSVLHQNYNDLEYFIIDGGSTDNSVDIIRKYSDRITWWVSEPDSGQAEAINKGLRRGTGEIVGWLNSDDMYAPGAIQKAADFLDENPKIGLVYGDGVSFDKDGYPLNDLKAGEWGLKDLAAFNIICQPAVFFRRELLDDAGYLDEDYHMLLDHHLWLRIARKSPIQHLPGVLAFARHHAEAKNVASASTFVDDANKVYRWMKKQPDLTDILKSNRTAVEAMVHRFNGRYYLDDGQRWESLKSYWLSFKSRPATALQEWHRMLFAFLSILGLGSLGELYYRAKKSQIPNSILKMGVNNIHDLYSGTET